MSVIQINRDPSRRQLNQFGFIWLGFLALFGALAWFRFDHPRLAVGFWVAAVAVPVVGWIVPAFMRLVFLGMTYAAFPIGFVVSHVVLAIVYYLVLTPIGLIMRLFGYDPMRRRLERERPTYWVERPPTPEVARYFRQF
jgi:sulfite exporter TauE/SafE